jgi:acetyltransferase-like isoleucine patch superfamily enzyme
MELPGAIHRTCVIGQPPEDRNLGAGDEYWPPQIAETARLEAFVTVDAGIKTPTTIGARTWLMKHSHVGHDAIVGADCEVAPGAVICGHAKIGQGVKIGVNASILPGVMVGDGARIGAGAVVTKAVPPGETWVGNPARPIMTTAEWIGWLAGLLDHEFGRQIARA